MRAMLRPWPVLGFALVANVVLQQIARLLEPAAGSFEWPPGLGPVGAIIGEPLALCGAAATLITGLLTFLLLRLLRVAVPLGAVMDPFVVLAAALLMLFGALVLAIAVTPGLVLAMHMPSAPGSGLALLAFGLGYLGIGIAVFVILIRAIHRRTGAALWRVVVAVLAANVACSAAVSAAGALPVETFNSVSGSMVPTLAPGDVVWVNRWLPLWRAPARGEVLVTRTNDGAAWVRRVVGLPGERVAVAGGIVRINGVPLPRVPAGTGFDGSAPGFSTVLLFRERGPEGTSWTVADQRGGGPLGIMAETLVPAGHLFMLGDNRANAMDSRMREVGMIPIAAVQEPAFRRITTRRDAPLLLAPSAAE